MYKLVIAMEDVGTFKTFPEAFREFFKKVREMIATGTSYQILETTCWIERHSLERIGSNRGFNTKSTLYFNGVKDLAYKIGLMKEMKIQNGLGVEERVADSLIDVAFQEASEVFKEEVEVLLEDADIRITEVEAP